MAAIGTAASSTADLAAPAPGRPGAAPRHGPEHAGDRGGHTNDSAICAGHYRCTIRNGHNDGWTVVETAGTLTEHQVISPAKTTAGTGFDLCESGGDRINRDQLILHTCPSSLIEQVGATRGAVCAQDIPINVQKVEFDVGLTAGAASRAEALW